MGRGLAARGDRLQEARARGLGGSAALTLEKGKPLSGYALKYARSVEAYLQAGMRPRWMERVMQVDAGIRRERQRVEEAYRELRAECAPADFPDRWRERAQSFDFQALNELITRHNEWYPIERDLPIDIRTRDYVKILGRSHRRPLLGPEWVLEQFPPD